MVRKYYENAYKLSIAYADNYFIAAACWNMAFLENNEKMHNAALKYSLESFSYLNKSTFSSDFTENFAYGLVYYYLGDTYHYLGKSDSAIYYAKLAIERNKIIENQNVLAGAFNLLAVLYVGTKDYDNSLENSRTSLEISNQTGNMEYLTWIYETMSDAYQGKGMYDSAYKYMKISANYADTLNQKDTRVLSAKLELSSKEKIFLKEKELAAQRFNFTLIVAAIVIISLITFLVLFWSRYRLKNRLNRQLAEVNATKDKFFAIISHDLMTPVSSFYTLSNLLSENYERLAIDEQVKHLKTLKSSSSNILKLLENLLTWARLQSGKIQLTPESLSIAEIVAAEVEHQLQFANKKDISIISDIDSNIMVFADMDTVCTVIRNLLSNALKFSKVTGTVTISAIQQNGLVEISIADTGIGIKEQDKSKLFAFDKKFSTNSTENEKGTGLGLNLCKEFVERNGGKIWFESEYGLGSTFRFTLPTADI